MKKMQQKHSFKKQKNHKKIIIKVNFIVLFKKKKNKSSKKLMIFKLSCKCTKGNSNIVIKLKQNLFLK